MHSLTLLCWGLRKEDVAFPLRPCQQTHHLNLESCGVVTTYFLSPLRAVVTSDQMSYQHLRKRDVKVRRPWWYQLKRSAVATLLTGNQINVLKMISYISNSHVDVSNMWCVETVLMLPWCAEFSILNSDNRAEVKRKKISRLDEDWSTDASKVRC